MNHVDLIALVYILTTLLPIHGFLYLARIRERNRIRNIVRTYWRMRRY